MIQMLRKTCWNGKWIWVSLKWMEGKEKDKVGLWLEGRMYTQFIYIVNVGMLLVGVTLGDSDDQTYDINEMGGGGIKIQTRTL